MSIILFWKLVGHKHVIWLWWDWVYQQSTNIPENSYEMKNIWLITCFKCPKRFLNIGFDSTVYVIFCFEGEWNVFTFCSFCILELSFFFLWEVYLVSVLPQKPWILYALPDTGCPKGTQQPWVQDLCLEETQPRSKGRHSRGGET